MTTTEETTFSTTQIACILNVLQRGDTRGDYATVLSKTMAEGIARITFPQHSTVPTISVPVPVLADIIKAATSKYARVNRLLQGDLKTTEALVTIAALLMAHAPGTFDRLNGKGNLMDLLGRDGLAVVGSGWWEDKWAEALAATMPGHECVPECEEYAHVGVDFPADQEPA